MHRPSLLRLRAALVLAFVAVLALSACSRRETADTPASGGAGASAAGTPAAELRLGYFPNITHAPALIGVANGYFQQELGSTKLTTQTFNAGPEEVSALLGSSLDAGFIGSGPAINAFAKSNGEAVRLIAGSTSGGAQLVVSPDITSPEQLKGKIVATPQAGNTQDIALKKWLKGNNLTIPAIVETSCNSAVPRAARRRSANATACTKRDVSSFRWLAGAREVPEVGASNPTWPQPSSSAANAGFRNPTRHYPRKRGARRRQEAISAARVT